MGEMEDGMQDRDAISRFFRKTHPGKSRTRRGGKLHAFDNQDETGLQISTFSTCLMQLLVALALAALGYAVYSS